MRKPPPRRLVPTTAVSRPSVARLGPHPSRMGHRRYGPDHLQQRWTELFREFDVVVCPSMSTPAFSHDHTPVPDRKLEIEGKSVRSSINWSGRRLRPRRDCPPRPPRSDSATAVSRSGCRSSVLIWKTARRSLLPPDRARVRRLRATAGLHRLRTAANIRSNTMSTNCPPARRQNRSARVIQIIPSASRPPSAARVSAPRRCPHRRARARLLRHCQRTSAPSSRNRTAIFTAG